MQRRTTITRCAAALVVAATALVVAGPRAHGQDTPATEDAPAQTAPAQTAPTQTAPAAEQHRPRADEARGYEEEPSIEPEDVALFTPRMVLFVPRFAFQLAFLPLEYGMVALEKYKIREHAMDILYNDARTAAVVPMLYLNSDFGVIGGLQAFHDDLGGHGERGVIATRVGSYLEQIHSVSFDAERVGGSRLWLETIARFDYRPREEFHGIGGDLEEAAAPAAGEILGPREAAVDTRYRSLRGLVLLRTGYTLGARPGTVAKIGVSGIYNHRRFGACDEGCNDPSIETIYDTAAITGFDSDDVNLVELNGNLVIDGRNHKNRTSSGAYFEVFGGGVPPAREYHYWHYGAELSGYIDVFRGRVFQPRLMLEATHGSEGNIPFSELPRLGGTTRLRGYTAGQFRDETAYAATLQYNYPIQHYIHGALYVDAGQVGRSYEDLFDTVPKFGGGLGFRLRSETGIIGTLDIAYGDGVHVHFTTDPMRAFSDRNRQL
jgi:hypothetical protein